LKKENKEKKKKWEKRTPGFPENMKDIMKDNRKDAEHLKRTIENFKKTLEDDKDFLDFN
jgi:hypothetical protein